MPYLIYKTRRQANLALAVVDAIWSETGSFPAHMPDVAALADGSFSLNLGWLEALSLATQAPHFLITAVEVSPALRDEIMSERDSGRYSADLVRAVSPRASVEDGQEAVGRAVDSAA